MRLYCLGTQTALIGLLVVAWLVVACAEEDILTVTGSNGKVHIYHGVIFVPCCEVGVQPLRLVLNEGTTTLTDHQDSLVH